MAFTIDASRTTAAMSSTNCTTRTPGMYDSIIPQIADTIWLMDRDKGVSIGTPQELAANGTLAGFFVRKGITFDAANCMFRIEKETDR